VMPFSATTDDRWQISSCIRKAAHRCMKQTAAVVLVKVVQPTLLLLPKQEFIHISHWCAVLLPWVPT
jgi:hypothetical protein